MRNPDNIFAIAVLFVIKHHNLGYDQVEHDHDDMTWLRSAAPLFWINSCGFTSQPHAHGFDSVNACCSCSSLLEILVAWNEIVRWSLLTEELFLLSYSFQIIELSGLQSSESHLVKLKIRLSYLRLLCLKLDRDVSTLSCAWKSSKKLIGFFYD